MKFRIGCCISKRGMLSREGKCIEMKGYAFGEK